ncbi:hypothetical protein C9374_009641 [Naegleria lovaniensis]|uniref:tRNA-binding domain-containing protein n=1 Tax=Naegleria lovaniensis TaxID=51637 RepID=A0AA88H3N2_NAELO|nr:uncharacterized protein C9374_009641 [Naegleria lovaniensis]KAG2393064.1 hypothetical protein C9374_009641 [Naegleria lovaniensis]
MSKNSSSESLLSIVVPSNTHSNFHIATLYTQHLSSQPSQINVDESSQINSLQTLFSSLHVKLNSEQQEFIQVIEELSQVLKSSQQATNMESLLSKLNDHLAFHSYLVNDTLSVVDVVFYVYLYSPEAIGKLTKKQQSQYIHLIRYVSHLKNKFKYDTLNAVKLYLSPTKFQLRNLLSGDARSSSGLNTNKGAAAVAVGGSNDENASATTAKQGSSNKKEKASASSASTTTSSSSSKASSTSATTTTTEESSSQSTTTTTTTTINPNTIALTVGYVLSCEDHPEATKLYVEKIAITPDHQSKILTICSGLKGKVEKDQIAHKLVLLMTNLKSSKMVGIESEGMLLAATDDSTGQVQVLTFNTNEGLQAGDRVIVDGFDVCEVDKQIKSDKLAKKIIPFMSTNENGVVVWNQTHEWRVLGKPNIQPVSSFKKAPVK